MRLWCRSGMFEVDEPARSSLSSEGVHAPKVPSTQKERRATTLRSNFQRTMARHAQTTSLRTGCIIGIPRYPAAQMMNRRIRAFNLVITAIMPTTTSNLCGDQPTAIEGSIILMMMGMPWVVIPGPKKSTMVARTKMIVVIMNTNMCPGEFNRDPLELQRAFE